MHENTRIPETAWHKASYSGNSTDCVEIANTPHLVGLRDTKNRHGGTHAYTTTAWSALQNHLRQP